MTRDDFIKGFEAGYAHVYDYITNFPGMALSHTMHMVLSNPKLRTQLADAAADAATALESAAEEAKAVEAAIDESNTAAPESAPTPSIAPEPTEGTPVAPVSEPVAAPEPVASDAHVEIPDPETVAEQMQREQSEAETSDPKASK